MGDPWYEGVVVTYQGRALVLVFGSAIAVGLTIGGALSWWFDSERPRATSRMVQLNLVIRDMDCDSGFALDWLENLYLVGADGERLERVSIPRESEVNCNRLSSRHFIWIDALIKPRSSWTYRIEVEPPSGSISGSTFRVSGILAGSRYRAPSVFLRLSADCSDGKQLCRGG